MKKIKNKIKPFLKERRFTPANIAKGNLAGFTLLNSRKTNSTGFTLIELLASISIVALVSGIFLANYHSAGKQSRLNMAAQKIASDIRLAQNYSLGSKEYGGQVPSGGWGVYFNKASAPESYKIFADNNGNKEYDIGEDDKDRGGQTISLPDGIVVSEIDAGVSIDSVNITFLPPDPTTNIWDGVNSYNEVQIELQGEDGNSTKTIVVNFFGLIEVID
ncbi:MAG: prepilin-type N-terminal cleavage/methylation domain-containing protein [Patescibacteria group bacterium]|nr:prepilin-type N-terminal cleavage/methylation domain-containing protein [Patescibacteria group bacterium]